MLWVESCFLGRRAAKRRWDLRCFQKSYMSLNGQKTLSIKHLPLDTKPIVLLPGTMENSTKLHRHAQLAKGQFLRGHASMACGSSRLVAKQKGIYWVYSYQSGMMMNDVITSQILSRFRVSPLVWGALVSPSPVVCRSKRLSELLWERYHSQMPCVFVPSSAGLIRPIYIYNISWHIRRWLCMTVMDYTMQEA